jgi:hypothetical protein
MTKTANRGHEWAPIASAAWRLHEQTRHRMQDAESAPARRRFLRVLWRELSRRGWEGKTNPFTDLMSIEFEQVHNTRTWMLAFDVPEDATLSHYETTADIWFGDGTTGVVSITEHRHGMDWQFRSEP